MTKVLMFGSGGFIGRNVGNVLRETGHDVVDTYRDAGERPGYSVDLLDAEGVGEVIERVQPEAIVNCAGIVQNNETAQANPRHTENIITQVLARKVPVGRLVILGSAAEYGLVEPSELPVKEESPLRGASLYAASKIDEVAVAMKYREESDFPVVVARIFNPIGTGMPERQLIPALIRQIKECKDGERDRLEINRLDSRRDYVDVHDLAGAIAVLATGPLPKHGVYNVGSGRETSNTELVDLMISQSQLDPAPLITEVSDAPEPQYASQADISRLQNEFGWQPTTPLEQTVKEIVEDARN